MIQWDMFQRKSIKNLNQWYQGRKRKPLILRGARQIGKSSLVYLFCKEKSLNLIEINFESKILESFKKEAIDVDSILRDIELMIGRKINPDKDLLFFDEIQKSPQALLSLRYFYEKKPEIPIIAAGSLLDFLLFDTDISFPVGRVEFLYIGPVSFLEFLMALKKEMLIEEYHKKIDSISETGHRLLLEVYHLYCSVGGMPEAVKIYLETQDLLSVRKAHHSILQTYKADFLKYAKKHEIFRCDTIFNFVPSHLGQKVKYVEIDPHEKSRDLRQALHTLLYAKVIMASYHTNATAVPLSAFKDESIFKLYFLDVGLSLTHMAEEFQNILHGESILSGAIAEQFVNQHLCYLNPEQEPELFYWLRDKSSSKAELDIVFSKDNKIIPIEIKSSRGSQLKSLNVFMAEHKKLKQAVLVSGNSYQKSLQQGHVNLKDKTLNFQYSLYHLPLWAIEKINEVIES